jgi:3-dehydroquinate synthase
LPTSPPRVEIEKVLECMRRDKKASAGRLRFVLPSRLGHVELVEGIEPSDVRAVLEELIS